MHLRTLEFILRHLVRVSVHAKENKASFCHIGPNVRVEVLFLQMEIKNISIVFGPTLVTCASLDSLKLVRIVFIEGTADT